MNLPAIRGGERVSCPRDHRSLRSVRSTYPACVPLRGTCSHYHTLGYGGDDLSALSWPRLLFRCALRAFTGSVEFRRVDRFRDPEI